MSPDMKPVEPGGTFEHLRALARRYHLVSIGLVIVSLCVYAKFFGWAFAAMLMVGIGVHEYGHVWAMKRYGVKVKGIYFIPFLGAVAMSEGRWPTRGAEAVIALMGPIWGLGITLLCVAVAFITRAPVFLVFAYWMALINLFNLLPANPMDGGRVIKSAAYSISPWAGLVATGLGLAASAYVIWQLNPMICMMVCFFGGMELMQDHRTIRLEAVRPSLIAAAAAALGCPATAEAVTKAVTETIQANAGDIVAARAFRRRVLNAITVEAGTSLDALDTDAHNDLAVFLAYFIGPASFPKMKCWQAILAFIGYLLLAVVFAGILLFTAMATRG